MGCGSEVFNMIFIITLLIFLSLQRTHILTVGLLLDAAGSFHVHGLPEMYYMDENQQKNEKHIKKISGLDENEEKQPFILEKFRALLGLKSFHNSRPPYAGSEFVSSSPSPSPNNEAEAPAPSPVLHVHPHPHTPRHHSHWNPQLHKIPHEDRGNGKRILAVVLVSVGVATLICALGCLLFYRKLRNQKKTPRRTAPLFSKNRGTGGTYPNSSSHLSLNSGPDLFYLNALDEVVDQHVCSLKQTCETINNATSSHCSSKSSIYEKIEQHREREVISSEYDIASSSSTKEILSVHEEVESSLKYESEYDGGNSSSGDKMVPEDCNSSDNESFHSLVDSHSSILGLSNASAGSLSETVSFSPRNSISLAKEFPCSPHNSISKVKSNQSPCSPKKEEQKIETSVQCQQTSTPPPLQMPLFSLHSLTSSSRISSHSPRSLAIHNSSSPGNSDSISVQNHSPENELPSPPQPSRTKFPPSIPPPPCPPPFLRGNSNNVKTPPPPYTQLGKDGAPLPKLKPLHWDKVRAAPDRTMVWDKIRTSSFELDEEMIESLFGYNIQNSMKNDDTKSKSPSPSKHVLEPKRLQNITILSKALNTTSEQVCEALIQGKGLSLQQLEALGKMVPTKEEEAKLSSYEGDINELASAEKFVWAMLSVPFAFQRVEAMLYRETFEDEVVHLSNSFSMLEEACKELRSSKLFSKLLEAVLKTGNRMNVGTIRGGARAFKLDALLKLADVKATDGKTTLLHFFVQEIVRSEGMKVSDSIMGKINHKNKNRTDEEKEEEYRRMGLELVSGLSTELYNVKKTATIDLDVLASSVSNLSDGMANMQHLVNEGLLKDEQNESFVNSMKSFLNCAERKLKDLQGDEDRVLARVKEITEYFHGDVSKEDSNPLRIFVIVRDFLGMLDNVCKELRRSNAPRGRNPLAPFR